MKALPLPLDQLHRLPGQRAPATLTGPINPRNFLIAGSWWLTREVELSTARACLVTLEAPTGGGYIARWTLPASKTDTAAMGTSRAHKCNCPAASGGKASAGCPVHALWDQLLTPKRWFPERFVGDRPDDSLPLFPTQTGGVVSKEAAVATMEWAALRLGVRTASPDDSERLSGHSLRVTGAQGLTVQGWHLWTLQLLGRWGSEAIKGYVREAPLEAMLRSSPALAIDIEQIIEALAARMPQAQLAPPALRDAQLPDTRALALEHRDRLSSAATGFIRNDISMIVHRQASEGLARCGWRFNKRPHTSVANVPGDVHVQQLFCIKRT